MIVEALIALVALTSMEVVLGIDNIVFITILTSKLPEDQQPKARRIGIALALVARLLLLAALGWVLGLDEPILHLDSLGFMVEFLHSHEHVNDVTIKDLILLAGGLFLIYKSVKEIHEKMEGEGQLSVKANSFGAVILQLVVLDIIFSLDSIITAVGMVRRELIWVMAVAIVVSVIVMLVSAESIGRFVLRHPTLKMLALSFLMLIGVMLVAEGIGTEIDKGYIYFAMGFALLVEVLNMLVRRKHEVET